MRLPQNSVNFCNIYLFGSTSEITFIQVGLCGVRTIAKTKKNKENKIEAVKQRDTTYNELSTNHVEVNMYNLFLVSPNSPFNLDINYMSLPAVRLT